MKKLAFVLLIPLVCHAQASDPRIGSILAELASVRPFDQVAISPDGKRVAWIEEIIENRTDTGNSAIYLSAGGPPMLISAKPASSDRNLAWSPDSTRIAFLSDRDKKGQMQLYVVPAAGGRPRKLTNLTGYLTDPQWSPDGTRLAVLFAENAPSGGGPLEAEPIETGIIGGEIHNQRLTVVDAASGAAMQVSPADLKSMNTIGRPMAVPSPSAPRPAPATTTGGSRNFTRWQRTRVK